MSKKKQIEMNCADCGVTYMAGAANVNLKRAWGQKKFYCPLCRRGRQRISFGEEVENNE